MALFSESRIAYSPLPPKQKIGQLLVESGALSSDSLSQALANQIRNPTCARIGDVLLANDQIDHQSLLTALSRQSGIGRVDLIKAPPDPELLRAIDPITCLTNRYLPWRKIGQITILAISEPQNAKAAIANYNAAGNDVAVALATSSQIQRCIVDEFSAEMAQRAVNLCPEKYSYRALQSGWAAAKIVAIAFLIALVALRFPVAAVSAILIFVSVANFGTALLRLLATGTMIFPAPRSHRNVAQAKLTERSALPKISVLVPLFRESRVLVGLLKALCDLDYPRELLDVKLILEDDDSETAIQLLSVDLPNWIEIVKVPIGQIRTKPRAMNYALPLCTGSIIGIYDAEDRPEPDQLRKVAASLAAAPRDIACVQGCLDFYNTRQNWLTRCFAIEYAQWFRVLLPGMHRLNAPIPLGGTTLFFRRNILEKLGGWDAHNVTEDAELGMRLARHGYRCAILDSTTYEEATATSRLWMRQRSRWLKGYAITWASHMRRPFELMDDLGLFGFLTFQVMFVGTLTGYMALPLHIMLWASFAGVDLPLFSLIPERIWIGFSTSHFIGLAALLLLAGRSLAPRSHRHLVPVLLTLPFYWPLGSLASWRALAESVFAPFYWAKTEHGNAPPSQTTADFNNFSKAPLVHALET